MDYTYRIAGQELKYKPEVWNLSKEMRVSFAFDENDSLIVQERGDNRPMMILLEMLGKNNEFEEIVRGIFDCNNIILFIGEYYMQVPDIKHYDSLISSLRSKINKRYGYSYHDYAIWNGISIGKVGKCWQPMELVGKLTPSNKVIWFN